MNFSNHSLSLFGLELKRIESSSQRANCHMGKTDRWETEYSTSTIFLKIHIYFKGRKWPFEILYFGSQAKHDI